MELYNYKVATIIVLAITAIAYVRSNNFLLTTCNLFIIIFAKNLITPILLLLTCFYSLFCILGLTDYIKKEKLIIVYIALVTFHLIQVVALINFIFSTI